MGSDNGIKSFDVNVLTPDRLALVRLALFMRSRSGMTKTLLSTLGALALATSLGAQQPSPATQPVRPPDRPPSGEPPPPLRAPEPDLGDRAKHGSGDGESRKSGEPEAGTLTLKGCLQRVASPQVFRLHPIEGDDATVTADVRLGGDVEQLARPRGTDRRGARHLRAGHARDDDAGVVQRDSGEGAHGHVSGAMSGRGAVAFRHRWAAGPVRARCIGLRSGWYDDRGLTPR